MEGAKTDVKQMQHLLDIYGILQDHTIVSYNTNIYELYNRMFKNADPDECDLLQILKEKEHDQEKKRIFDERYSDILLIFDFDPQDAMFTPDHIDEMLKFFSESTDHGKLYVNYPMVESFYHMKSIPDNNYNSYIVTLKELIGKSYKSRVREENRNHDYRKFAVNRNECNIIISQNINKAQWITGSDTHNLDIPSSEDILKIQLSKLIDYQLFYVLAYFIFLNITTIFCMTLVTCCQIKQICRISFLFSMSILMQSKIRKKAHS